MTSTPDSRRQRRGLIGLIALLLILAAVVTPIVVMQYRDGSSSASTPKEPTEPTETATPTEEPEPVEPILLGTLPFVSPCSLVPLEDVERIFGDLGDTGFVTQEYVDASISQAEFEAETRDATGKMNTRCSYAFDDRGEHNLNVTVDQYRTERIADGQWAAIAYMGTGKESAKLAKETFSEGFGWIAELARENERDMGGKPVAGVGTKLLYVPGHQSFVMRFGNVVVTARYGTTISVFEDKPLTRKQYAAQAPRMKQLLAAVEANWADHATDQAPLPTAIGGEAALGDTPYLEPCAIFDAAAFEVTTGRAPDPGAESVSLIRRPDAWFASHDDAYQQSPRNTCARKVRWPKNAIRAKHSNADLEIRYAMDSGTTRQLLQRHLVWRYVQDEKARDEATLGDFLAAGVLRQHVDTDADELYIFDSTPITGRKGRYVTAFFTYGPYEFMLSSTLDQGIAFHSGKQLTDEQYAAAVDAVIANVKEATGE